MENTEKYINAGIVAALSAVKKTLAIYQDGMTPKEVLNLINEIDQQLGVKEVEIQLLKNTG